MSDILSKRIRTLMHLTGKVWEPRKRVKGEASPPTFNHLKDGQTYKSDWPAPSRRGALDHVAMTSKGDK
jgi:hypothetical protein